MVSYHKQLSHNWDRVNIKIFTFLILIFPTRIFSMDEASLENYEKNEYQLEHFSFETILKEEPETFNNSSNINDKKRIANQEMDETSLQKKQCISQNSTETKNVSLILVECSLCIHWFSSTKASKVAINTLNSNFNHHLKEIHQIGYSIPEKFYTYEGPIPKKLSSQNKPLFFETIKEQFQEYQPTAFKSKKTKKNEN